MSNAGYSMRSGTASSRPEGRRQWQAGDSFDGMVKTMAKKGERFMEAEVSFRASTAASVNCEKFHKQLSGRPDCRSPE